MSDSQLRADFHHLLLRADSRFPDDLVVAARGWLAEGRVVDIAQALAFTALTSQILFTPADAELLADALRNAGADAGALGDLAISDVESMPECGLAPVAPDVLAELSPYVPHTLDLTGEYAGAGGLDPVDLAAVAAAADLGGSHALWRSWRYPPPERQSSPSKRMYLLYAPEVRPDDLPAIAADMQTALLGTGEQDPLVQVFADEAALPAFQRAVLSFAALLWTILPLHRICIARFFDDPDQPGLDQTERARVLQYLDGGDPLIVTAETADDVFDPAGAGLVPLNVRTDGVWVWSDATAYYLEHHHIVPDPWLLRHLRQRGYERADVDVVGWHRALAALQADATPAGLDLAVG
ncbi:hypothetical protein ABZS66_11455 [Dactylosporangium sp. NPDC005572]|uniref:hypothetical protein n=1 Tax=Dactylosporangium sp. NPDC005572 TaxID=3156889 RepID=UPI0033B1B370